MPGLTVDQKRTLELLDFFASKYHFGDKRSSHTDTGLAGCTMRVCKDAARILKDAGYYQDIEEIKPNGN